MCHPSQIIAILCLGMLGFGCAAARISQPLTTRTGSNDDDSQAVFWEQLADEPVVCNDDFCHALLLYLDKTDPAADYAGRVALLKSRGLLPADFNHPADEAADRGVVAVAVVGALKIQGGLMMTLLGPQPRYATRELQYLNLYPQSSPQQEFSGQELVGIISRMEDYQRGDVTDLPATAMPSAP